MKNLIITASLLFSSMAFSQINTQSDINSVINNQNPFLDASGYASKSNSSGKGLYFPRTDLTKWEFTIDKLGKFKFFKSAFDGMIVYNIGTGKIGQNVSGGYNANTQGKQIDVEPGFYYFSNPNADLRTKNVAGGQWVRIGSGEYNSVDYKKEQVPTGDNFFVTDTESKPVYRKMVDVDFGGGKTYAKVPNDAFDANAVLINAQLVSDTGKVLSSVEFRKNTTVGGQQGDYVFAAYNNIYTTLSGKYRLIAEYYVK